MSIFKSTSVYTIGMLLPQAMGFILLPVYSRFLSKEDFSLLSLLEIIVLLFSFISALSVDRSVIRFLSDKTCNKDALYGLFFSIAAFTPFMWLVILAVPAISNQGSVFYGIDSTLIFFAAATGCFRSSIQVFIRIIQYQQRLKAFALISIFRSFLDLLFITSFLLYFIADYRGPIYASLITAFMGFLFGVYLTRPMVIFSYDRDLVKKLLLFTLPIFPTILLTWSINMASRVFLESHSLVSVAEFSMAYKISYLIGIIAVAMQVAISSKVYQLLENKNLREVNDLFVKATYVLLGIVILHSFVMIYFGDFILGKQYLDLWRYILILNISFFISGVIGISSNLILYHFHETKKNLYVYGIVSILTLILFSYLNEYGVMGITLAILLSNIILAATHMFCSYKHKIIYSHNIMYLFLLIIFLAVLCLFLNV